MKKYSNKKGYSIILALFLVGFMLILTTGVFKLVLAETRDTRGLGNYLKAFSGAEGSLELGLLKLKENSYSYDGQIDWQGKDKKSIVLAETPRDKTKLKLNKDVLISNSVNSKKSTVTLSIPAGKYSIIPLFYKDKDGKQQENIEGLTFSVTQKPNDVVWNILSNTGGISGKGDFASASASATGKGSYKTLDSNGQFSYEDKSIKDFLKENSDKYLIIFNGNESETIEYTLNSGANTFFIANIRIVASGKVGEFRQNIRLRSDASSFLNLLKYSIYSQ